MKKLETVKKVIKVGASIGITAILNDIINENTSEDKGIGKKIVVFIGALVLGGMICSRADDYIDKTFDEVSQASKEAVEEARQKQKEN